MIEDELRERIERLETRQATDDASLLILNRYWNQVNTHWSRLKSKSLTIGIYAYEGEKSKCLLFSAFSLMKTSNWSPGVMTRLASNLRNLRGLRAGAWSQILQNLMATPTRRGLRTEVKAKCTHDFYPFSTKAVQRLDGSQCLFLNQFFVFLQPKNTDTSLNLIYSDL